MHLSKLELCGFKSFADRTEIQLTRGLTVIVGPNGCGKSNVVDAIRWALGEQSARSLRGGNMQDVIFNGGGRRGPSPFAEVALHFDNRDRLLAVEKDDVKVTRRLSRAGESEYLLNGKPCRLRDIRELLLDTGVGQTACAFVEQGKIDALLHASPEERRAVLEEAAGIGKHKLRKKETVERLATAAKDRERLAEVLAETTARERRLRSQAEKARRYVELRERLRALRLEVARRKKATLLAAEAEARERARATEAERARLGTEAGALAAAALALAEDRRRRERTLAEAETAFRETQLAFERRRQEAEHERRREKDLEQEAARLERNAHGLETRAAALAKEAETAQRKADARKVEDASLLARAEALKNELADLDGKAQLGKEQAEAARRDLVATLESEARARNGLAELEARTKVLKSREERLARRRDEVRATLATREAEAREVAAAAEAALARAEELEDEARAGSARREDVERRIREAEERFQETRRRMAEADARIEAIARLEREGFGLEPGARALIALGAAGGPAGAPGAIARAEVVGPLADLVKLADRKHALAIEAALGPAAQWVAVRTAAGAVALLDHLAAADAGRATLFALDTPPCGFVSRSACLADHVGADDPAVAILLRRLTGGVHLVADRAAALALRPALGPGEAAVTLAGERIGAEGTIAGGHGAQASRIETRCEREALAAVRASLDLALAAVRAELERLRGEEKQAAQALERARAEQAEAKLRAFGGRKEREEREKGLARLREEDRIASSELAEIARDFEDGGARGKTLGAEAARLRAGATELEARAADLSKQLEDLEAKRSEVRDAREEARLGLARGAAHVEGLRATAARAEREAEEARKALAQTRGDQDQARGRLQAAREAGERAKADAEALAKRRAEREAAAEAERRELERTARELGETREKEQKAIEKRGRLEALLADVRAAEREAKHRLADLAGRLKDDLGADLEALAPPEPEAPGAPAFNEVVAEEEASRLREAMEALGNVNLEAIAEAEEVEKKRAFLAVQQADLEKAEGDLRLALKRIDEHCRTRFLETFEAVRGHFQTIFRKLFGGGRADLVLEAGADPLEAGVDVQARPPGKEARTLSLLSGGEKTLATVALLMAVFRAKPGPFCILDEVDAALDEHNVTRLSSLLREMVDRSQFLIVSHSKRTMASADALYGITMPEPGVSAPISVRLGRVAEEPADGNGEHASEAAPTLATAAA